jgi:SAM-dependent methyltransferase
MSSAGDPTTRTYDFVCNICGMQVAGMPFLGLGREGASCFGCGSSVRMRSIVHVLSTRLFGQSLPLANFPVRKDLVGAGLSDWPGYAELLKQKFSYINTFYHTEPRLDILAPGKEWLRTCDFLISSDVFEHIPPPVRRAFVNSYGLLRPGGLLVLTVPYGDNTRTVEHFPKLHMYKVIELGGDHVLVNRIRDGRFELHTQLVFHGGPGDTLEMRVFALSDTLKLLAAVGFVDIRLHQEQVPEWGIILQHGFGLPITARRPA